MPSLLNYVIDGTQLEPRLNCRKDCIHQREVLLENMTKMQQNINKMTEHCRNIKLLRFDTANMTCFVYSSV